jgi:hypothetical protein
MRGHRPGADLHRFLPSQERNTLKHQLARISRGTLLILIAGLAFLGGALFLYLHQWPASSPTENLEWNLLLVGRDGQQVTLSLDELRSLPSVETRGGFFSTVGVVYGPYTVKGIPVETLCDLVGGIGENDLLDVAAQDGYSSVYDYRQLKGDVDTFDPATLRLVPQGGVRFLLIFEQQGKPLADGDGRPLRLALTNPDGLITEGHWWVRWVNRIEIRRVALPSGAQG